MLDKAASTGIDTGGARIVWDPEAEGFFLRRTYDEPPGDRRLIRDMNRLQAAGERWLRNGSEHGSPVGNLWWSQPPPADYLQMSELRAAIAIGPDPPPGDYQARIKACEPSLERCVTAATPFRVLPGVD